MKLTGLLSGDGAGENGIQVQKELRKANGRIGSIWDVERQDDIWKTITVQYHLNSGKKDQQNLYDPYECRSRGMLDPDL